jgi:hypothetical protein
MTFRNERTLLRNVLSGAGLYLLDSVRDHLTDNARELSERARNRYDDLRTRAADAYATASKRLDGAKEAMLGEDRRFLGPAGAALIGVGLGVGIGMLLAPASGEETRRTISQRVRDCFSEKSSTTGTSES